MGSGTDAGAIECFNYLVALEQRGINIRVTSNSWGEPREKSARRCAEGAIDAAGAAGILNVFAAGNDGTNNDVRAVRSRGFRLTEHRDGRRVESVGRPRRFSNYGATSVDLAAPGDLILSTLRWKLRVLERHEHGGAARAGRRSATLQRRIRRCLSMQ